MDDQLKRLKRFIYISWSLLLAIIIGLTVWGSVELRNLHSIVQLASAKTSVVKGINGTNGTDGTSVAGPAGPIGLGENGADGQSVTPDQIATAVSTYLGLNPPAQGEPGVAGNDGRTLQIQVTSDCQLQTKYSDSDGWVPIAQLPIPCLLNPTSP